MDALLPKDLDETEEIAREAAKNNLWTPKLDRKAFNAVAAAGTVLMTVQMPFGVNAATTLNTNEEAEVGGLLSEVPTSYFLGAYKLYLN